MQNDQKNMLDVLEQQQLYLHQVDRALKIALPITAFLLSVICANFNTYSFIGTLIILIVTFYATAIKRMSVHLWLSIIIAYCLVDIFLSYGAFPPSALGRQLGTMLTFTAIIGFSRPYIDQWYLTSKEKSES